jgi:hypothetical protein
MTLAMALLEGFSHVLVLQIALHNHRSLHGKARKQLS